MDFLERERDMKCPVCGNNTFSETNYEYDICKECFWEYDPVQVEDPDFPGGANVHSLNEYRKIYQDQYKQHDRTY